MAELLLELLSEEIPARMQARAAEDLRRLVCDGLKAAGLASGEARAFATPRRLALVVDGLPVSRPDVEEEKRGPRVGAPDQAIQGFLKSAGFASLDEAERRDTGKGEFWFAVSRRKGGPTAEALPAILLGAIRALPWPKSMKWGAGSFVWVRPLHSIVAVFDGRTLEGALDLGGGMAPVRFGDTTLGHRFLSSGAVRVDGFVDYVAALRREHAVLDAADRKRAILEGAETLCAAAGIALKRDEGLLDEVAGLVEWPVPLLGCIEPEFMDVPPEVLVTSMRTHQKYFACLATDGTLAPRFVVVANNVARDGGATIVAGNERVLRARLSDAKFFWDQDLKTRLADRLPALAGTVFHAKLGSQRRRVERLVALVGRLAGAVKGWDSALDLPAARQAAELAKADLTSGMVGEFPELQGVMGRYYARHEGLAETVCEAIGEHYSPLGPGDRCPSEPVSVAIALADKLDLLAGFWAIGEKPTGSRDPFALRRAALGAIRLVVENGLRVDLARVLEAALEPFAADGAADPATRGATVADLLAFFVDRLKVQAREQGVRHDLVNAATGGTEGDFVRLLARVRALQDFVGTDDGRNLLVAYGRAANIVRAETKKEPGLAGRIAGAPDPALFAETEERAVADALAAADAAAGSALAAEDFTAAMAALAALRAPLDAFFDRVTVNAADRPDLRLNRLKLLGQISATIDRVADFSKIEG